MWSIKTCWWCNGELTDVNTPMLVSGLQTREVNVHLGDQTRDDAGLQICVPLGAQRNE